MDGTTHPPISVFSFAERIKQLSMKTGVSINPSTNVSDIYPLLGTGLIELVDLLAVKTGFGGQSFNPVALEKIKQLKKYRNRLRPKGINFEILVDGGINQTTSKLVTQVSADILVAGTALFRHPKGFSNAVKDLQ